MAISRRSVLTGGGAASAALVVGGAAATPAAAADDPAGTPGSALLWDKPGALGAPSVTGLHLQFGADASREVVVSWLTLQPVAKPHVQYGTAQAGLGRSVEAETRHYRDGLNNIEVFVHHARLTKLQPGTRYVYFASHQGSTPESGVFETAPRGRQPFTFTSFGDQGTPNLRKEVKLPPGTPSPNGPYPMYTADAVGTQASADIVAAIERVNPLFNLVNGDLCYASIGAIFGGANRVQTWADWFISNSRSARFRPWMPCVGNHENEKNNGPVGAAAYQAYFTTPDAGADDELKGLWYAFTAGSVRIISLANCDVTYEDGGDSYIRGYSGGAQRRWLESELKAARADRDIDWIVVCMHQPFISSNKGGGSDLGVREAWGPLFDQYGVDLVVSGHEHHYERSHPVRGRLPNETRTPTPVSTKQDVIDTGLGTVHMIIGGGGNFATSENTLFERPQGQVIVALSDKPSPILPGHKDSVKVTEDAPWASVQDRVHKHGFAAFEVDPGDRRSGRTRIKVTYYTFDGAYADLTPVDRFILEKDRADARH
ncbi:purple acid phosphatase family protein [Uniformispora flossi]|uniref:purple acid phosphatase family protein n=1 Tax=Uniformispora flossi TaxID=3390723 RepID=UPI003C2F556E